MLVLSTSDNHGLVRPWERGRTFRLDRVEPTPSLARIIERYWIVRWDLGAEQEFRQEILPHPSINLVVEPDQTWAWGVPTRREARVLTGTGWAVGLKFQPGVFTACTGIAADRLTDTRVAVDAAFGRHLTDYDPEPSSIIDAMEALLAPWERLEDPALDLAQSAIAGMYRLPPTARVHDIADINHLAPRTLQRLFKRYIGVGPKWVLKRLRIHQAVERIAIDPEPNWTELALELGYYDHAHFIRDFRLIVGRSPTQHAREAATAR
jgi:AraC-like DNA-binding protein